MLLLLRAGEVNSILGMFADSILLSTIRLVFFSLFLILVFGDLTPTQEQVAHQQDIPYKVKYRCKFCEMLWLDKLALFFQILATFPALYS